LIDFVIFASQITDLLSQEEFSAEFEKWVRVNSIQTRTKSFSPDVLNSLGITFNPSGIRNSILGVSRSGRFPLRALFVFTLYRLAHRDKEV
jgi:hypothetical protein